MPNEPVLNQTELDMFLKYLTRLMETGKSKDEAPALAIIAERG